MSDKNKVAIGWGDDFCNSRDDRIAQLERELEVEEQALKQCNFYLAEARKDTQRLDWLEAKTHARGSIELHSCAFPDNPSYCWIEIDDEWNRDTLRQAIDNAMKGADDEA